MITSAELMELQQSGDLRPSDTRYAEAVYALVADDLERIGVTRESIVAGH